MILSHTALGQEELMNGTENINNPHVTMHLPHFVAFLLSTIRDRLAPVIFIRHMSIIIVQVDLHCPLLRFCLLNSHYV